MLVKYLPVPITTLMLCVLTLSTCIGQARVELVSAHHLLSNAEKLHDVSPDSAFLLYQQAIAYFEQVADSRGIIMSKIGLSDLYKNDGFYHSAFDELWDAQILAEEAQDTIALIQINRDLGSLYSIYQKYHEAISHFSASLHLAKQILVSRRLGADKLHKIYYSFAVTHRKAGAYELALLYLDSCLLVQEVPNPAKTDKPYVLAERGIIYLKIGRLDEAQAYLELADDHFSQRNLKYRIFTHLFLGDLYVEKKDYRQANAYYRQSLISQENSPSHGDSKVEILKKLAASYQLIGERDSAYKFQGLAIAMTDSLFNARTAVNNQLFRIRDKHDELIRAKNDDIHTQQLIIERDKVIALRLKLTIGFMLALAVGLAIILRLRRKLQLAQLEQARIKVQAKYDREKADAIMNVKSRELTTNTLQLIEKDRLIEELLEELKSKSSADYHAIERKVTKGNRDMWDRFDKRFTEVDPQFYTRLREKHPGLTSTEHRHCALIKLGFDSKEMASILGISLSSVHISRHRIRKKMGLDREDNLSEYITRL